MKRAVGFRLKLSEGEEQMFWSLLPFGYFGPASWRTLIIVSAVALVVASLFCYLLIYAANYR